MGQALKLSPFGPISPRTTERLLTENYGQTAANVRLLSGDIRPIREPGMITSSMAGRKAVYRAEYNNFEKWRGWMVDVDVARLPLTEDVEPRYVWSGDGPPKMSTFSNFDIPTADVMLGIPIPLAKAAVSVTGGAAATVSRVYVYTFFSRFGEESAPSPVSDLVSGKVDGSWTISGMSEFPISSGAVTGVYAAPDTEFTSAVNTWLRVGDQIKLTPSDSVVLIKSVTGTTKFKVAGDHATDTFWIRPAPWNVTGMKRRLYRSVGTSPSFQLVAEDVGTSYTDTLMDSQIPGDELISESWLPPPPGLFSITSLPNGALVGLVGNLLCQSEPYQFHAWPVEYQRGMNQTAVGLAAYGTTMVIGTTGAPYIGDGVEPASVTLERHDNIWPCLSKRSMISVGDGVIYATLPGLVYIGSAGPRIWTQPFYTREEWIPLDPYSMICATAENKIFILYHAIGSPKAAMLCFQPLEPLAALTTLTLDCIELYSDPRNGYLYVVDTEGVKLYDSADGPRLPFEWLSKEFELPTPCNFGAARVEFVSEITAADAAAIIAAYEAAMAALPALLANGSNSINGRLGHINRTPINGWAPQLANMLDAQKSLTFTLYSKGVMKFSKTLYEDTGVFRLPSGYLSDVWSVKLNGQIRVKNVKIAETPDGLRQI